MDFDAKNRAGGDSQTNNFKQETVCEEMPEAPSYSASTNNRRNNPTGKQKSKSTEPECIDLTNDEEEEELIDMDDEMSSDIDLDDDDEEMSKISNDEIKIVKDIDVDLPELVEVEPISKKELAEDSKRLGNEHFKVGQYNQALQMYYKAIELQPTEASYYGNRGACYMMLKKYQEALKDNRTAIELDPTYEKGYLRLVRVYLALGDSLGCSNAVDLALKNGIRKDVLAVEVEKLRQLTALLGSIKITKERKDHRRLIFLCDQAIAFASGDLGLKTLKADALVNLGRYNEASELCTEIIQADLYNVEAIRTRAICFYQADNLDKCLQFLKQGLSFDPGSPTCLSMYRKVKEIKEQRESAATLYKSGKLADAKTIYLECNTTVTSAELKNTCIESKLQFNLALIAHRLRSYDESIRYSTRAIEINSNYYKAYVHRATVYTVKEMHEDAARDLEAALKIDPTKRELKTDIQNAKMAAKKAKRKDYYKILDIDKTASDDDIRKAYKKRAMLHHPDRHASASEDIQKEQEKNFKDVGEAYEVLSDSKKRFRYDQGHDLMEGPAGGGGSTYYDPYDANQIFNMFFTGTSPHGGMGGQRQGGQRTYQQFGGRGGGCSYGFHRQ